MTQDRDLPEMTECHDTSYPNMVCPTCASCGFCRSHFVVTREYVLQCASGHPVALPRYRPSAEEMRRLIRAEGDDGAIEIDPVRPMSIYLCGEEVRFDGKNAIVLRRAFELAADILAELERTTDVR